MSPSIRFGLVGLSAALYACGGSDSDPAMEPPPSSPDSLYSDATAGRISDNTRHLACMDAESADIDQDGDTDLILAIEFSRNVLLLNDGGGSFSKPAQNPFSGIHDSEDVEIADFTGDGLLDVIFVSEDDFVNEYYVNLGSAAFQAATLPVEGKSNGVAATDLTGDGIPELAIANSGDDFLLVNDGEGNWTDDSVNRIPGAVGSTSQDVEFADVDGDGDPDLMFANEGMEQLLINTGNGFFTDETAGRLPQVAGETREVDFGDVDDDGDLDIVLGNVIQEQPQLVSAADTLLLNDGIGVFAHSDGYTNMDNSYDVDFTDLDDDGDLDIVTASADLRPEADTQRLPSFRAYLNDGSGRFTEATIEVFGTSPRAHGFDVEAGDFNGDGLADLYLCSRGSRGRGTEDYLFLRN